jgi:haloacetate dehalogenase
MILADPEAYWGTLAGRATHKLVQFSDDAVKEYKDNLSTMEGIHAVRPPHTPVSARSIAD